MIRSFARLTLLLAGASALASAVAQRPARATLPDSSADTQAAPANSSQTATLKARAQLVVVDVVVMDGSKKPVHGLKASDFTLKEGGTTQVIKNFEEHTALTFADATRFPPMRKLPPGVFTNYTPAPANGAVNVLLLDSLNTPMADQAYVRQQLLAYLKATPPGTRVAIFGLTTQLVVLQGFTSDSEVLKRIVTAGLAKASPLLEDQVGGSGIQSSAADIMEDLDPVADAELVANLRQFDAQRQSVQLQARVKDTLDAMNEIARYLAIIPGRKNLIWFSGSFPLNVLPDATINRPFDVVESSEDEFRETVRLMARSQVAVYPIDARGLMTSPVYDASTTRNYGAPGGKGIARMNQDQNTFTSDTQAERGTMEAMAEATGGRAFVGTNGLTAAVASAIDEGSNFYSLAYTPTNSERDGKFRKITIELAHKGPSLSYRKGYYADQAEKAKILANQSASPVTNTGAQETMRLAMMRGAPTPSEIVIRVGVVPINPTTSPEDLPAPGNTPTAKIHGPYRRYSVNYIVDPTGLAFLPKANGELSADFSLIIYVYDPSGGLVNSTRNTVHITSSLDKVEKLVSQGIFQHAEVSVPIHGEYFFRIAVHDLHRDHYGAVEVATSEVKNIAPLAVPPADPAAPTAPSPTPH